MKRASSEEIKSLCQVLKQNLRSRGLTQSDLARSLKVSLPTVKRWLQGKGLDLKRLLEIGEFLGLDLATLVAASSKLTSKTFEYTADQEKAFTSDLELLSFFDSLLQGNSVSAARRESGIPEAKARRYLRQLENLKLLELHPQDRIRLLVQGEPQWSPNGPLATRFRATGVLEFTRRNLSDRKKVKFGIYRLFPEDKRELVLLLEKAYAFARTAEIRGRATSSPKEVLGLLTGISTFDWKMLEKKQ